MKKKLETKNKNTTPKTATQQTKGNTETIQQNQANTLIGRRTEGMTRNINDKNKHQKHHKEQSRFCAFHFH